MRFQQSQPTTRPQLIPEYPLHLLIVEDLFADVELIKITLEAAGVTFTYDRANTGIACQEFLRSQTYHAVLSDYHLPNLTGLQVLNFLQQSGQDIPLILVTGTLGEEAAVECIKAGMTDYVLKERLFRLPTVLARALQEFELRRTKQAAQAQIQRQAWREATINRIVQTMRGTLVLEEVLQTTADQLHEVLQVSRCLICQPDLNNQIKACYISQASEERQCLIGLNCDFSEYYQDKLDRGESVVLNRMDAQLAPELQESARDCGIRSLLVVPLLYRQSYLGGITLHQCDKERQWTTDELALVTAIADQCAIAIHQAQLYQQAQTELAERKRLEGILRHQAEQLAQANRLKDEFLAIVSHELRTPLSTILCWAQLLCNRKLSDPTLKKAIESIERSAKAQVRIVDDLLDVSRIRRGKIALNARSVDLAPVIEGVIEDMRPMAEVKAIHVESVLDRSVGFVLGDLDRLQQIIWNLLSNALKFTPVGGRVNVRLSAVTRQSQRTTDRYAQIQVSDTGIGIAPDFLPHVFERFRQADSTITREYGGLGLGLAIVHHLVELHGGTVQIASEGKAKGTTVTVQLPAQKEKLAAEPHPAKVLPPPSSRVLKGSRVLVVDDDAETSELLTLVLQQYGAQVTALRSQVDAITTLTTLKPDIIISDISMSNEDSYSLIDQVRVLESEQGKQTPAVALTAFSRDEERDRALKAGFQMYVPKPVEPTELVTVVAHLVAGSKSA